MTTVPNQLRYQVNWELVILWVRNIPVDDEEYLTIIRRSRSEY